MNTLRYISFVGIEPAPPHHRRSFIRNSGSRTMPSGRFADSCSIIPVEMPPLAQWLLNRCGLNPLVYRANAMERRIAACLRHLRGDSQSDAISLLKKKPELCASTLNILLIGVTSFFRDPLVFENVRTTVVPTLARTRERISICSMGVSDGRELYSIAMLLAEAGVLQRSSLMGVDCRTTALRAASTGVFDVNEMEPASFRLQKYFVADGSRMKVRRDLQERIQWWHADIFKFDIGQSFDLILFRNVAIYLEPAEAAKLWSRFSSALTPGGFLVTGKAEQPPSSSGLVRIAHCIYRKSGGIV